MRWPWQPDAEKVRASREVVARAERLASRLELGVERLERVVKDLGDDKGGDGEQRWRRKAGGTLH